MEKYLKNLYKKFLKLEKYYSILDDKKYSTSLRGLELSDRTLGEFYNEYRRVPFFSFLKNIKDIIYSKNVFDFVLKNYSEDWHLWPYLKFLEKEKIVKIKKNGRVSLLKKDIVKVIPEPKTEKEIKKILEKKLKIKIKEGEFIINLFKKFQEGEEDKSSSSLFAKAREFQVKSKWDQMPISQGSAIFVVRKILEKLPLNKKFLFVGDDDFISVILGLVSPGLESLVIDADEELLSCIRSLARKFNLKIETKKVDIRKEKSLGEKFTGFLTSPVYTEAGVKEFVGFGKNQFGKDGGFGFLNLSDESIGNRFLFLQEFFIKNNLIIKEIITGKVYYPYIELYREDREILRRLSSLIDERVIKKSPKIGAALYIMEFLPLRPKRVKFKKPIYAYL